MAILVKKIKGTEDVLPKDSFRWQFIEKVMLEEAKTFGYKEIRTPVFEDTRLFERGVGETTDVVQKEMYTFETKGGDMITLRPEGTAGAARAMLEHALYNEGLPVKVSYFVSCYRYEKPQAGRLREFHQFALECYGTASPLADAEIISAAKSIFDRLQIRNLSLEINSIGCPRCRKIYHEALKAYFENNKEQLCDTCRERLEKNPMRILDCKSPICKDIAKDAPMILDYLCDECSEHFTKVKEALDEQKIEYKVNPRIVRGLDYYTRTVFEFISKDLGAQSTVCGGGRYDGLIEELGGKEMPALGWALGMERLLMIMQAQNIDIPKDDDCDIYIGSIGNNAQKKALALSNLVRASSMYAECDIIGRGVKAQMKYADKIKAKYSMIIGDDEISSGVAKLKNMQTGNEKMISLLEDKFIEEFIKVKIEDETKEG